jgi:hypothetical protein
LKKRRYPVIQVLVKVFKSISYNLQFSNFSSKHIALGYSKWTQD